MLLWEYGTKIKLLNRCQWQTKRMSSFMNWYLDFRSEWRHRDSAILSHPEGSLGCGDISSRGVMILPSPGWRHSDQKLGYQFSFYHDATKHTILMLIRMCKSSKSLRKLLRISHYRQHSNTALSQQYPKLRLGSHCEVTMMPCHQKVGICLIKNQSNIYLYRI